MAADTGRINYAERCTQCKDRTDEDKNISDGLTMAKLLIVSLVNQEILVKVSRCSTGNEFTFELN